MSLRVVYTGRPIVAGEEDRSITFTEIGVDWAGEGYTLKLRVTDPDCVAVEYTLDAVVGETEQGKLSNINGVFVQSGIYTLKLICYVGTDSKLISEDYYLYVRP